MGVYPSILIPPPIFGTLVYYIPIGILLIALSRYSACSENPLCPIITYYVHHHIQLWCFTRAPHLAAEMQTCDAHKGKDLGFENCGGKKLIFFPTCQVRVVRFYQSCSPPPPPHPPPPLRSPDPSGHCRTSPASCRSQWALPDLNRDFQVAVGTAGPQSRAPDPSGHCRTSTASSRSQ